MIQVERVDLNPLGIVLPSDRVGMVVAQPNLQLTAVEPYRCAVEAKPAQLAMVAATLKVALQNPHGLGNRPQ